MVKEGKVIDDKLLYVICPKCKSIRQKINGKFNIMKRGKERNDIARFFCINCGKWFNEHSGEIMTWHERF